MFGRAAVLAPGRAEVKREAAGPGLQHADEQPLRDEVAVSVASIACFAWEDEPIARPRRR